MKKTTLSSLLLMTVITTLSATGFAAGNADAGKNKAFTCMGCHGVPGYNNTYPTYHVPKLGGQHAAYIVSALKAYQAGQRPHATMKAQTANMSEQDMQDIAAFFAQSGQ